MVQASASSPTLSERCFTALRYGNLTEFEALITEGADINAANIYGETLLHVAVDLYRPVIVQLLLEAGAAVDIQTRTGDTPLWRAVNNARGRGEIIKRLIDAGANPYRRNLKGASPIDVAREAGNQGMQHLLIHADNHQPATRAGSQSAHA